MNDRYRPQDLDLILAEAAYLVRTLGGPGARHHVVLIGGLAPSLLVPSPLPDDPHMGTTDIDICLDVALTSGDTEGELWTQINQPGNTDEALARARRAVVVIDEFARTLEDVGFG